MATIKILETHKELNECGCNFFCNTSEIHLTRVTSTELRWLSVRTAKGEYISPAQEFACAHVDAIADSYGSNEWDKINMKILLYVNPIKSQHHHIKNLLKCGADIRYIKNQNCTRLVIQDNKLFFTVSSSQEKVVNSGILYTGKKINDPLINYYTQEFDSMFLRARPIEMQNNRIVFRHRGIKYWYAIVQNLDAKDWINLIFGAILGTMLGLLATITFN